MSRQSARGTAWQALRLKVLERDGHLCGYCGGEATEADHIIPKSAGGKDDLANLVGACKPCNSRKGSRVRARLTWFNTRWLTHV